MSSWNRNRFLEEDQVFDEAPGLYLRERVSDVGSLVLSLKVETYALWYFLMWK